MTHAPHMNIDRPDRQTCPQPEKNSASEPINPGMKRKPHAPCQAHPPPAGQYPPFGAGIASMPLRKWLAHIWMSAPLIVEKHYEDRAMARSSLYQWKPT
jgi:hypothetical protein